MSLILNLPHGPAALIPASGLNKLTTPIIPRTHKGIGLRFSGSGSRSGKPQGSARTKLCTLSGKKKVICLVKVYIKT